MSYRRLIILALLGALPTISWAQFTTFIPPQTKTAQAAKAAVVAQERARTDSVMRIRLTDMKAWVDSAAGSVAVPNTATDPVATPTPAHTVTVIDTARASATVPDSVVRVRHGARAPDTASDLPMLALIGAIALAIGTVMLSPALNSDVIVRKLIGFTFFVSGGLLLSFVAGRYAVGIARADGARGAWEAAQAQRAVARARAVALSRAPQPAPADGAPIGRLVIPRIDLDEIVLEGIETQDLNAGPGHLPGSVLPGERGNSIVSAHRDRHFNHFDALNVGDTVITESRIGKTTWVIVSQRVVDKDARALFRTSDTTLTLTTCWPIRYLGSAPSRLIVTAKPVKRGEARVASAN